MRTLVPAASTASLTASANSASPTTTVGAGVLEHVGDLFGREVPVHRHDDETHVARRSERFEPFVAIVADDAHRVAEPEPESAQTVNQAVDSLVELPPRPLAEFVDDREVVAAIVESLLYPCHHVEPPGSVG